MVQIRRLSDAQLTMAIIDAQATLDRKGSLVSRDELRELTTERERRLALVHGGGPRRTLCGIDVWSRGLGATTTTPRTDDITCPECRAKLAPLPVAVRWVR